MHTRYRHERLDADGMRCPHCPAPVDELCRGEAVPRFCQLVDATHPDYQPAYKRILVRDDYEIIPGVDVEVPKATGGCCDGSPYPD